jgi:hypothetical protein
MPMYGVERTVIAVIGDERNLSVEHLEAMQGVERVMRVLQTFQACEPRNETGKNYHHSQWCTHW